MQKLLQSCCTIWKSLGTVDQVHSYLKDNLSKSEDDVSKREFLFVNNINRERPEVGVETAKGTRQFHCVRQKAPYTIYSRNLSCFCKDCLSRSGGCKNNEYVEDWQLQKLTRSSEKKVTGIMTELFSQEQINNDYK